MSKKYSADFCEFCYEIHDGIIGKNSNLYKHLKEKFNKSRIIFQTDNWIVMPTVGCFTKGYILAVSRLHVLSLNECNFDIKREFINLSKKIQQIFKDVYQCKMVYFEHGTIHRANSSCSVEHAHVHFIPMQSSIWGQFVSTYNPIFYEIDNIEQLSSVIKEYYFSSYLLFRDIDDKIYVIVSDKSIYPSQFFRFFISNSMGMKDTWNWKKNYYIDNMYKTYIEINDYLKKY